MSDDQLRRLENAIAKALFTMLLHDDSVGIKSANYLQDGNPTITLKFPEGDAVVVSVTASRLEHEDKSE